MSERAAREVGADPIAMAALNELLEASLEVAGPKKAGAYLKVLSARVASPANDGAVPIRGSTSTEHLTGARAWLRNRLPHWLSRYG